MVRGPCTNHQQHRPAAWFFGDGTALCDPCYFRQQAFNEIIAYLDLFPNESAKLGARLIRRYMEHGPAPDFTPANLEEWATRDD
jgi:hypothetical protein